MQVVCNQQGVVSTMLMHCCKCATVWLAVLIVWTGSCWASSVVADELDMPIPNWGEKCSLTNSKIAQLIQHKQANEVFFTNLKGRSQLYSPSCTNVKHDSQEHCGCMLVA